MPPNPGHLPPSLTRADLKFRNGHVFHDVDRLDELRWTIAGVSSDITDYRAPRGKQ
jgi:hypothetical protein